VPSSTKRAACVLSHPVDWHFVSVRLFLSCVMDRERQDASIYDYLIDDQDLSEVSVRGFLSSSRLSRLGFPWSRESRTPDQPFLRKHHTSGRKDCSLSRQTKPLESEPLKLLGDKVVRGESGASADKHLPASARRAGWLL
jgi:hypothetical protein